MAERILILDGHTNQALACVRSLGEAGYELFVASDQRFPLSTWSRHCRGSFRLEEQSVEAFALMREWAKSLDIRLVLPLTERSCSLCNAGRAAWEELGITVGCGPDEMLRGAFDKARTLEYAAACGVSIPPTRFPSSLDDCLKAVDEIGLPCVVKPRLSNAWDGKRYDAAQGPADVKDGEGLIRAVAARKHGDDWPLIQGYVPGQGKGVFALCDRGRVVAWFAHERLRDTRPTGSGSSLRRSVALETRLREPSERLLSALKWHGPAMVEFRDDQHNPPCLMEVNGRFWGSLQLGVDAGVNFPLMWVSILKGERVEATLDYTEGLTLRWLLGDVKRFVRILRGAPEGYPHVYPSVRQGIRELLGPQPAGTRLEMWRTGDPWPAVGELAAGFKSFLNWRHKKRLRRSGWRIDAQSQVADPISDIN
jgi:predicted ATP-grasp superfamily ATP-dependent carboligase